MSAGRPSVGLHVEDSGGSGPRVLLLHSSGLSGRQWRRLADQLVAKGNRVIVPDLSGHGRSDPWPEPTPFSYRTDVERVAAIVAEGAAHVVGHSYGGFIALQAMLADPSRVRSLALYEPTAFGVLDARDADARATLAAASLNWGPSSDDRELWLRTFVDFWSGQGGWLSLQEEARTEFRRVAWVLREGVRTMLEDATLASAYAAARPPTLLLAGSDSPLVARRVVKRLADALPGARAVTIEGAGHLAPITNVSAVNRAVVEALESIDHGTWTSTR
jgi:pimeloyl-ACP methyl ester carboxylesterase